MPLTEEEEKAIELYRTSQYSVAKIIDRLVKENEDYFRIIEERGVQITNLCDRLDAIKKAWG